MFLKPIFILSLFLANTFAHAQVAEGRWKALFESAFYSDSIYEPSQCNQNVRRFLKLAAQKGFDTSEIQVIEMVNKGISNFGMVGAKNARTEGTEKKQNWFHHVFLKLNNTILDFDFTMEPTPANIEQYFSSMYTTAKTRSNPTACLQEIGHYFIEVYSGTDYLRYYEQKIPSEALDIQSTYLKNTRWACQ